MVFGKEKGAILLVDSGLETAFDDSGAGAENPKVINWAESCSAALEASGKLASLGSTEWTR